MHQRTVVGGGRPRQPRREKVFRPTIRVDEPSSVTSNTSGRGTPRSIFTSNNNNSRPNGAGIISGVSISLSGGGRRTSESVGGSSTDGIVTPRAIIVKHRGGDSLNRVLHRGTSLARSQSRENNGGSSSSSIKSISSMDREVSLQASAAPLPSSGSPARGIVSCESLRINDIGHSDYGHSSNANLDDPLLSKLVSRVLRDDDRDRRLSACRQLRDFAGNVENSVTLRKAGLGLIQELARVFFERTSLEVKEELAQSCGLIAVHLAKDAHSYLVWLFRKYDSTGNEEVQILLLQMLLETMKNNEVTNKLEFPLIMTHARKVLENTDSQQLLVAIVDIVLVIVAKQPEAFQPHFHDTVDILIGWHIDPQQSESVIRYTADALISFNRYWVVDVQFSVTLLGQLLEDIEAYTEHQNVTDESVVGEEDLPAKITSLIRVYSTIVSSLGDFYTDELSLTDSFVIDSFSRLLACVLFACTTVASNKVFVAANNCVILLLSHVREDAVQQLDQLSSLIELQFKLESCLTVPHAVSLLKLVWKVVIEVNSRLPVNFLSLIMGEGSTIPALRFMPSNDVQFQLLELYRAIFRLKTVSLLEEAYRHVLEDLHSSFTYILKWNLDLVPPAKQIHFVDENEARSAVLFDLCAIAEVGSTKNSLIAMLAFNPSIFDLLTIRLKPTDLELGKNYPSLQYAIVLTLYSYCTKHSHFVNNSSLINESDAVFSDDRPTASGHFSTILDLLGRLLFNLSYCCSVRSLALKWSQSVIEGASTYLEQICKAPHFVNLTHALLSSAFNGDTETCLIAGDILFRILLESASNLGMPIWSRYFELCLIKISDLNAKIRELYLRIFTLLPMGMIICKGFSSRKNQSLHWNGLGSEAIQVNGLQTLWQARRRLQCRSPLGTFTVQDFRTVMAFVLQGTVPSSDWLREMFALDQRTEKLSKLEDHTLYYLADTNEGILWFWAANEAALFCILSKLRTPLGKAQDTLATIEVAIKSFASESVGQSIAESPFGEIYPLANSINVDGDPYPSLLRGKLLLNFLEALEKLIYNSYEGCAVALAPPPKAVKTFFRTNKATCREWLSRIRKAVMTLALHLGYPAYAVRQGYQLLSEMARTGSTSSEQELRQVILMVVQALTTLRCPEPILGLYVWAKDTMGIKLTCIKASVDMAAGRYEEAAQQFICILDSSASSKEKTDSKNDIKISGSQTLEGPVASFMRNQIIESFRRLGSWTELREWLNTECVKFSDKATSPSQWRVDMSAEHIATLSKFDGLNEDFKDKWAAPMESALQLWPLCPRKLQQNTEKSLIAACLSVEEGAAVDLNNEHCALAAKQIAAILRLSSMESASLVSPEVAVLYHEAIAMNDGDPHHYLPSYASVYSSRHFPNAEPTDMESLIQLLRWVGRRDQVVKELKLMAARTARKHQNLITARRLNDWFTDPGNVAEIPNFNEDMRPPFSCISARRCTESAKLLRCLGRSSEAVQIISSSVVSLLSHPVRPENKEYRTLTELNARSILTLVKWFQVDPLLCSSMSLMDDSRDLSPSSQNGFRFKSGFAEMLGSCQASFDGDEFLDVSGDLTETVVGKLLWIGTRHCPWLSKGWLELASWCYKAGKKSVNRAAEIGVQLTAEELLRIVEILPEDSCEADVSAIAQVLSQVHCVAIGEELVASYGMEPNDEESTRRHVLVLHPVLYSSTINAIDSLMSLWNSITSRVYTHYRMASEAYFTFLKLNSESDADGLSNSSPGEDGNVMATLRLLRLMVKHASELRDVLELGLANTPTSPWKGIIPQLFARLNHPEPYVRRSISDLLCRVTAAAPHLIVFPAVVGSSAVVVGEIKDSSGILGECLSQPAPYEELLNDRPVEAEGETSPDDQGLLVAASGEFTSTTATEETRQKAAVMQNCFAAMVDTLAKRDPRSIAEVQKLVHELRRITLLWDEFWLGTLNQYHLDFSRRITQLEKEIAKVRTNASLTAEERSSLIAKKHETFLRPTLFVLEQLQQVTSQPPETPHEEWFQATFSPLINDAIEKLKKPATPEHPQANWQLYKQLLYSLQQQKQKRSNLVLNMAQISPTLATMKSTGIAMPGAPTLTNNIITIQSIDNVVSIMPTKTKPKKLVFYGSDGKKYPFLFKGLEDLHLDERIMQLLTIVNNMFARNRKKSRSQHQARHYSVTPLGPRSGLIQWVEGATPLFGLYKRWQQREAVAPVTRNSAVSSGMNAGAFLRPSEIFYNKLTPLLKEHGIGNLDNRKDWPLPVLRQVLLELMSETPSDLLARELWCASDSALDWWSMTENYAQSTAVMSIIGYIIGLGDRHLDNVLVDLETGEVVHIDYNVCFEKGRNLRVPEKVPFRMTQNIRTALGFTGVEGTFRLSCEHVLKTLRRGRETLLTLLDAFVYDPLIDWTPGSEGGYTGAVYGGWQGANVGTSRPNKEEMEKSIVHNMFYIRMVEMKSEWLTNRDDLVAALPKLEVLLQTWLQDHSVLQECEEELQGLHQEMAFMKEAEANPSHPLHTLHQRCVDYMIVKSRVETSRSAVQEKLSDCNHWHRLHEFSLETIRGPELPRWRQEVSRKHDLGALTSPQVTEFLQAAGKGQLLQQCEQAEKDIVGLLMRQQALLQSSLDTLATYATVISQAPLNYAEENRIFRWQNWLQELQLEFTLAKCQEIISSFHSLYGSEGGNVLTVHAAVSLDLQLQELIGDTSARMHKLCDRLRQENPDNSNLNSSALSVGVQECLSCVAHIAAEHGAKVVTCVIGSALSNLSYRLASLESTARSAGDQLANFTSRDGDWFLDEFYSVSSIVDELVSLAASVCDEVLNPSAHSAFKAISAWHQVVTALQELYLNFRTIILPEALKCLLLEDSSVKNIFVQLESLVSEIGVPLTSLVQQLELQVRHVVMKMDPPQSNACQLVDHLRSRFKPLIEVRLGSDEASNLTSGQMLLMGFDGLFTKLETDFWQFRELSMPMLSTMPPPWRKVNVIKDARALLSPSFLDEVYHLLSGIFFVKQLQAMTDFFALLQRHCWSLRSAGNGRGYSVYVGDDEESLLAAAPTLYSEDCLAKPILGFIAEFICKMVLGLPAQALGLSLCHVLECCGLDVSAEVDLRDVGAESKVAMDDLCRKVVDLSLRNGSFQPTYLNQVGELVANLERMWRKQVLVRRLGQNIMIEKSVLQRAQLQLTYHQWIHEDLLMQGSVGGAPSLTTPTRSSIMTDMRKNMQGLLSMESGLSLVRERYLSLGNSVEQRLRWAAGANPSISSTLEDFEQSISAVNQLIVILTKISAEVASVCGSILHFEAFRSRTSEAMTSDNGFLQLINRCQESCLLLENCASVVSLLEEKLLQLKPLEKHAVISDWIASVTNRISCNVGDVQRRLSKSKGDLALTAEAVKSQVIAIRVLLGTHHRLMNEIRTILKSMVKYDELQLTSNRANLRQYVAAYRAYSEHITVLVKEALSEEFTVDKVGAFLAVIQGLKSGTAPIYDTLVTLGAQLGAANDTTEDSRKPRTAAGTTSGVTNTALISDEFPRAPVKVMTSAGRLLAGNQRGGMDLLSGASPASQSVPAKILSTSTGTLRKAPVVTRDPRTGKAVQERNSYAVGVWKRVKMKLDGRDPDGNKRLTVSEQVDYVISEAMSLDNLASLYEGWTPWV